MKKILTIILAFLMLLPIVGCANGGEVTTTTIYKEKLGGWLIEVGEPQYAEGVLEGQMCLDQDTYNLYQFTNGEWILIGCIRGDSEEAPSIESKNGVWYINGRNTKLFNGSLAKITVIGGYIHINGVDTGIMVKEKEPDR